MVHNIGYPQNCLTNRKTYFLHCVYKLPKEVVQIFRWFWCKKRSRSIINIRMLRRAATKNGCKFNWWLNPKEQFSAPCCVTSSIAIPRGRRWATTTLLFGKWAARYSAWTPTATRLGVSPTRPLRNIAHAYHPICDKTRILDAHLSYNRQQSYQDSYFPNWVEFLNFSVFKLFHTEYNIIDGLFNLNDTVLLCLLS